MKTSIALLCIVSASCAWMSPAFAGERGADGPRSSLFKARRLDFLAVSAAFEKQFRDLRNEAGAVLTVESRHAYGTLSCDLFPWFTVHAGAGQSEVKPAPLTGYGDNKTMWTAGCRAGLWQHDIKRPDFLAGRCGLFASVSYWDHEAEVYGLDLAWDEWRSAVTASAEFFVPASGIDTESIPYSVIFSAGAVFSDVDLTLNGAVPACAACDSQPATFEEDRLSGLLVGIDVNVAENVTVGWEGRFFEDDTHNFKAAVHF